MTLVTANPRRKVRRNNSIFDAFFNDLFLPANTETVKHKHVFRPAINVIENKDAFKLDLAIPGFSKEDVSIKTEKDILTIEANKEVKLAEGEKYLRKGFAQGAFNRTFHLPDSIDLGNITANFSNGILTINLAKKEEAKELPPRTIEING